jgi:hypothetical protein
MVFIIAHKAFIFSMGNIINININWLEWQTIHHMVWGLQELICAPLLTTKAPNNL